MPINNFEILDVLHGLTGALKDAASPDDDTPNVITKPEMWAIVFATAQDALEEIID